MSILGFLIILIINMVLMLVLTMMMASLTLIESKFLALVQSSVGPNFVGYKGSLQYIADALKLFVKGSVMPDESNKAMFVTMPSMALAICYSFWMNSVWGPSMSLFEMEYNLIYISLFSVLFGMCVMLTGYFSKNKYAMLASVRTGMGMLNLELFLGLMILNVVFLTESFSFLVLVIYQENFWFIFLFFILCGLMMITFLLETSSAPFDLPEAESELVTGYSTEYGGFFFGLYYLGEYLHLFFFSLMMNIMFFGGWEFPNMFLNFLNYYYSFDMHTNLYFYPEYVTVHL